MYRDVLQPGDTFTMMMRKMVMAITAIIGIVPLTILIQMLMGLKEKTSTSYPCYISMTIILIGSWIYVKWTHMAPTWLIAFWANSISVICLLNMLTSPNSPYEFTFIGIIMIVLLCKAHSVNLIAPVMCLLVFGYNFSLGRTGAPYPLMMLPDGVISQPN